MGLAPNEWSPVPRRRPEQFRDWSSACLNALGEPPSATLEQHLSALERHGLPHVAAMLAERTAGHGSLNHMGTDGEKHPQARKIAAHLRTSLDARWLERLLELPVGPSPEDALALTLGGLPPNFATVSKLLEQLLQKYDPELLSPLQFFTLATGCAPAPPVAWQTPLAALEALTPDDLVQLNSLSRDQLKCLRKLESNALTLLALRERIACSDERWSTFGTVLLSLARNDVVQVATALNQPGAKRMHLRRLPQRTVQGAAYLLAYWPTTPALLLAFKDALTEPAWQNAADTGTELRRVIARGEFRPALLERVHTWNRAETWDVYDFLQLEPALSWCEDAALLDDLRQRRSAAWLELVKVFPTSVAYLSQLLSRHYRDALLTDWCAVAPQARRVSEYLTRRER